MDSKRLWVEYKGSWPNQCYHFDGKATPFWTLSDGRQVADAKSEGTYRWLLENEDTIVPFVAKGDGDWKEVAALVAIADRQREVVAQREAVASLEGQLSREKSKALADMERADALELEAQRLRAGASDAETAFAGLAKRIAEEKGKLEKLIAPEPEPEPKKPPARKPKKKE